MKNKKNYIQTYSGVIFYPLEPDPDLILLPDIAHALSNQCRFGGHVRKFHSVAQHCVQVANLLKLDSPEIQLAGLLHDATEAYLVDLPKPIKNKMPIYVEAEERLLKSIADRFNISFDLFKEVKESDRSALAIESSHLMAPLHADFELTKSDIENVSGLSLGVCWTPEKAEKMYLEKFSEIWFKRLEHS